MLVSNKVSIIIPCYNAGRHLELTVQSVLEQSYQNIEVIIIDDHSNDDSFLIAKELSKKHSCIQVFQNNKRELVRHVT
jgi:glycosyltransferase involved in cell wall biosynthesis